MIPTGDLRLFLMKFSRGMDEGFSRYVFRMVNNDLGLASLASFRYRNCITTVKCCLNSGMIITGHQQSREIKKTTNRQGSEVANFSMIMPQKGRRHFFYAATSANLSTHPYLDRYAPTKHCVVNFLSIS